MSRSPSSGNHFTLAYFLTGETVTGRGMVTPLRPFDPAHGSWGPGAFEAFARYSQLTLGETVFTARPRRPEPLDPEHRPDRRRPQLVSHPYIKIYFDWQHSAYGSPVLLNPAKDLYGRDNDLFWIRCQLYY